MGLIGEKGYDEMVIPLKGGKVPIEGGMGGKVVNITQNLMYQVMDGPSFRAYLAHEGAEVIKNVTLGAVSNDMAFAQKLRGK